MFDESEFGFVLNWNKHKNLTKSLTKKFMADLTDKTIFDAKTKTKFKIAILKFQDFSAKHLKWEEITRYDVRGINKIPESRKISSILHSLWAALSSY